MQLHIDRLAVAAVATTTVIQSANAYSSCSWTNDCFSSPQGNLYSVGQCGYGSNLNHMRDRFVAYCNATPSGYHYDLFWHQITTWYPVTLSRKEGDVNDTAFVDCLKRHHKSAASRTAPISAAAVVGAVAMAFALHV